MSSRKSLAAGLLVTAGILACSDSTGPPRVGPPALIRVIEGDGQSALAGTAIKQPILLRVEDAQGGGVPDQAVTFEVVTGLGHIARTTDTTNADGRVDVPSWTLGKYDFPQLLRAVVASAAGGSISVEVSGQIASQYDIELRFAGPPLTSTQRAAFENASARIQAIITGDVLDIPLDEPLPVGDCAPDVPALQGLGHPETIDDLVVYAVIDSIDGPGKNLAFAGFCYFRAGDPGEAPVLGLMVFDQADVRSLELTGRLESVILHEMLHVTGFSHFLWRRRGLSINDSTPDWSFTGVQARDGCVETAGASICGMSVPIESEGGKGTIGSHWRECAFPTLGRELMTGFINSGSNPLSVITVGSLGDVGYQVNRAAADPFEAPDQIPLDCSNFAMLRAAETKWEHIIQPVASVDRRGVVRLIRVSD